MLPTRALIPSVSRRVPAARSRLRPTLIVGKFGQASGDVGSAQVEPIRSCCGALFQALPANASEPQVGFAQPRNCLTEPKFEYSSCLPVELKIVSYGPLSLRISSRLLKKSLTGAETTTRAKARTRSKELTRP